MNSYRGYGYVVSEGGPGLFSKITPPGNSWMVLTASPQATLEEGVAVLEGRIRAVIDADIETMAPLENDG